MTLALVPDVELVGEFRGSGRTEPSYLAKRPDGAYVELTRLLYVVTANLNGKTKAELAEILSDEVGERVSVANVEFLLGKLAPLGLVRSDSVKAADRPELALGLRVKRAVVPSNWVSALSRPLHHLFHWPIVVAVLGGFGVVLAQTVRGGYLKASATNLVNKPVVTLVVLALTFAAIVFHELGHASAARFGGAQPGAIGGGFYLMWPALYTDLGDVTRLKRSGRVRADLGGVYFNAVLCCLFGLIFHWTHYLPLILAIALSVILMAEQLLPFVRFDGYWIVSDLAGVPDLFPRLSGALKRRPKGKHAREELKPYSRRIIRLWAVVTVVVLPIELAVMLLLSATLAVSLSLGLADRFAHVQPDMAVNNTPAVALDLIQGLLLALVLVGLVYAVVFLAIKIVRYAARRWGTVVGILVLAVLAAPVVWSALSVRLVHTS